MVIFWSLCFLTFLQNLILWVTPFLTFAPALTFISILYVSFLTSSSRLPFSYVQTGAPSSPPILSSLLSIDDLPKLLDSNLKEPFGEDTHFLLSSLPVASEPHIQLSEGHAHLHVLQIQPSQPADSKALTPQEFCISARSVLLKFNTHTSHLGHLANCRFRFSKTGMGPEILHF